MGDFYRDYEMLPPDPPKPAAAPQEALEALSRLESALLADLPSADYLPPGIRADVETVRASLAAQPVVLMRSPQGIIVPILPGMVEDAIACGYETTTPTEDKGDNRHG